MPVSGTPGPSGREISARGATEGEAPLVQCDTESKSCSRSRRALPPSLSGQQFAGDEIAK